MDGEPQAKLGSYVEFDPVSLRSATRIHGGVFQLTYSDDVALLTFGYEGAGLPAEGGELDGKNFAETIINLSPRKAENLTSAMVDMIGSWVAEGVLDVGALHRILPRASASPEESE